MYKWIAFLGLAAFAACSQACSVADFAEDVYMNGHQMAYSDKTSNLDGDLINAIATLRVSDSQIPYLRIDAANRAEIVNRSAVDGIEVPSRVVVRYEASTVGQDGGFFTSLAFVRMIAKVEEGQILTEQTPAASDPVDIIEDWMSGMEDGYLTIHYRIRAGGQVKHSFSLWYDTADPHSVRIIHDACSDQGTDLTEGIICFPLDFLPQDGLRSITVSFKSLQGESRTVTYNEDS